MTTKQGILGSILGSNNALYIFGLHFKVMQSDNKLNRKQDT